MADVEAARDAGRLARALAPSLAESVTRLGASLDLPLRGRLVSHRRTTSTAVGRTTPDPCAVVRVGVVGSDRTVLVDLDVPLALGLVDRSLGGTGASVLHHRPNPAERAVLALVVARVLQRARPEPAVRVLGIASEASALRSALAEDEAVHVFEVVVAAADVLSGVVRVIVPAPVLRRAAASPTPTADLGRLEGLQVALRAEVGRAELARAEVGSLAAGDVVLLDEASARPVAGAVAGVVGLRLPRGRRARVRCRLDGTRLVVEDVDRKEEVPLPSTKAFEAGALLSEVPVEVTVEIGRVDLSARELVDLASGDTLVLERRPGDPVELRAADRLLGRGELVEVDGKIGVHVLELVR
jgi:flagellar motor switch protein FliM